MRSSEKKGIGGTGRGGRPSLGQLRQGKFGLKGKEVGEGVNGG